MENFNKFKDWLLTGVLLFIAAIAMDIRDKVYELDKKTVLIDYRIDQLEKSDKNKNSNNQIAYMKFGEFIMPTRIEIAKKYEEDNQ